MIYVEGLNVALAIWLIASPYILSYTEWTGARLIADFFGSLILGMAITRMAMPQRRYWWLSFGDVFLGAWIAISPFVAGYHWDNTPTINAIVVGVLVAIIAASGFVAPRN